VLLVKKYNWLWALLLFVSIAFTGCGAPETTTDQPQEEKAALVDTEEVVTGNISSFATVTGKIAADTEVSIIPKMGGKVAEVNFQVGDRVHKGDVLVRLESTELQAQLATIEETQAEVMPLLQRMLSSLEQFIELDVPFLEDERADRLAQLKELMVRPEVTVAEKYRRVLEAYQIESDYGRTLEAWRGSLDVDGRQRVVEFLRLGRLMLFYQTLDGHTQGYWNNTARQWQPLPASYNRTLQQGLNMARQQQTPALLRLPLPPVSEQGAAQ